MSVVRRSEIFFSKIIRQKNEKKVKERRSKMKMKALFNAVVSHTVKFK